MEFLTERKKDSHQKYNAKQVPGKGPAIARANGAPPWGQGLRPNLRCSGNCLRANIRDSVLWEQKAGAISCRASCLTAGCSWAWSAGTSACTWDPVPGWAPGTSWVGTWNPLGGLLYPQHAAGSLCLGGLLDLQSSALGLRGTTTTQESPGVCADTGVLMCPGGAAH